MDPRLHRAVRVGVYPGGPSAPPSGGGQSISAAQGPPGMVPARREVVTTDGITSWGGKVWQCRASTCSEGQHISSVPRQQPRWDQITAVPGGGPEVVDRGYPRFASIRAMHLPGTGNSVADYLSRQGLPPGIGGCIPGVYGSWGIVRLRWKAKGGLE
ncbi:hypothetical protein CRENBAI_002264 [Crenichthys baileyi]|uniref:Uncharacterized protein n=1 Tax=Crenichthys baileyi TaxID=28760 RepID=A0AAV9SFN9_9TELE